MANDEDIASESVTVTLPMNLLAQIDAQVGGDFVDREDFMRAAARHYLVRAVGEPWKPRMTRRG